MAALTPIFYDFQKLIPCFDCLQRAEPENTKNLAVICKTWNQVMLQVIDCNEKSKINILIRHITESLFSGNEKRKFSKIKIHKLFDNPTEHPKLQMLKKLSFIFSKLKELPSNERRQLEAVSYKFINDCLFFRLTNSIAFFNIYIIDDSQERMTHLLNVPFFTPHEKKTVIEAVFDPLFKNFNPVDTEEINKTANLFIHIEIVFLNYLFKLGFEFVSQKDHTAAEFILRLMSSHCKNLSKRVSTAEYHDLINSFNDHLFANKAITLLKTGGIKNWQAAKNCNYEIKSKEACENNLFDLSEISLNLGNFKAAKRFADSITDPSLSDKALNFIFTHLIAKKDDIILNDRKLNEIIANVWNEKQQSEMKSRKAKLTAEIKVKQAKLNEDQPIIDLIESFIKDKNFKGALISINLLHNPDNYSDFWSVFASIISGSVIENPNNLSLLATILQIKFSSIQEQLLNKITTILINAKLTRSALCFANAIPCPQARSFALGWVLKALGYSLEDANMHIEMINGIISLQERLAMLEEL